MKRPPLSCDPPLWAKGAHAQTLLGRRGRPDEIASAVVWFAGPGARYTTGQTLHVNGGAYLGG